MLASIFSSSSSLDVAYAYIKIRTMLTSRTTRLFLISLYPITSLAQSSSQKCYWPNGEEATVFNNVSVIACGSNGVSQCCFEGSACLSNGLCFDAGPGSVGTPQKRKTFHDHAG